MLLIAWRQSGRAGTAPGKFMLRGLFPVGMGGDGAQSLLRHLGRPPASYAGYIAVDEARRKQAGIVQLPN